MRPYRQGSLDGLCGVYSIINALSLVTGKLNQKTSAFLLNKHIALLVDKKPALDFFTDGISGSDISFLLKEVGLKDYGIKHKKPFHKAASTPLNVFWDRIVSFLSEDDTKEVSAAVIISIDKEDWSHWSVVYKATHDRLYLYDSGDRKILYRQKCSTQRTSTDRPYLLCPTLAYFLKK